MGNLTLGQNQTKSGGKQNLQRGRLVKTTNIDFFLNCDYMNDEEIELKQKEEKVAEEQSDEEEPEWGEIDVEELKKDKEELNL